ncbi:hypothetical protein Golax_023335, partial [Gossypium laxum]|nr:hypothetical protein [Gossypium laxum]
MSALARSCEFAMNATMGRFKVGVLSVEGWGYPMHITVRSVLSKRKIA